MRGRPAAVACPIVVWLATNCLAVLCTPIVSATMFQQLTFAAPDYDNGIDTPAWSLDGMRVAFASDRSGCQNIWLASDLRTVSVERKTWSSLKALFR